MPRLPLVSATSVTTPRVARNCGNRSMVGCSHQSTSPARSAEAAVAASGTVRHSTRSSSGRLAPARKLGGSGRGT